MSVRELLWDGCVNIRDLGGLPTEDGSETRFGAIVRSDNVRALSDEGWRALTDYGVERIVDLRLEDELAADPPRDVPIDVVHAPLVENPAAFRELDEVLHGIDDPVVWRRENYLWILERFAENFARAVRAVGDGDGGTVLIHCQGGVDRTGLVSALILRDAGVAIDTVAADYGVSEANWSSRTAEWVADAGDDVVEREKRKMLTVMPPQAMKEVLVALESRHGSSRGYLVDAGMKEAELDRLRARLRG